MRFPAAAGVILGLSITSAMAQSTPQATTTLRSGDVNGQGSGMAAPTIASLGAQKSNSMPTPPLRQRVEDMQNTVNLMHGELKQMQAKVAKSSVKDSLTKTNLDMWELMVGHLDNELQDLQLAVAAHEDMEARRVALYKLADQKAEAQAKAERAAQMQKFADKAPASEPRTQSSGASPANSPLPGQSSTPPAASATSPN